MNPNGREQIMTTSKFFGGVRGFAIAGISMRTRIFLFLFFASTSGLWAQEARQVREVREERAEDAQAQEARELPQGRQARPGEQHTIYDPGQAEAAPAPASEIVNRRIRVGEKKDGDSLRGSVTVNFVNVKDAYGKANSGNGTGGNRSEGGIGPIPPWMIEFQPGRPRLFVRGDVNGDSQVSIADAMAIIVWWNTYWTPPQFQPSCCPWSAGFPCLDAADADDDGYLTNYDALKIIRYVFLGFVPLPAPSASSLNYIASDCGEDLTGASLGCLHESVVCN
jgi:hypothetical protein